MAQRHEDWIRAAFTPEERAEIEAEGMKLLAQVEARQRARERAKAMVPDARPGGMGPSPKR